MTIKHHFMILMCISTFTCKAADYTSADWPDLPSLSMPDLLPSAASAQDAQWVDSMFLPKSEAQLTDVSFSEQDIKQADQVLARQSKPLTMETKSQPRPMTGEEFLNHLDSVLPPPLPEISRPSLPPLSAIPLSSPVYSKALVVREAARTLNQTRIKPKIQCQICQKLFTRPYSYNRHQSQHTGEFSFPCPQEGCPKKFAVKGDCTRHINLAHKGQKLYFCKLCPSDDPYRASRSHSIRNHLLTKQHNLTGNVEQYIGKDPEWRR